jgi:predicted phosphodiesterase
MRTLVLSDIHANLEALEAVLAACPPASVDRVAVLGDLVGYGADPNAVVARVRDLAPAAVIRGNHDKVATGLEDAEEFNRVAREAALWTSRQLETIHRDYLRALPAGPLALDEGLEICHGTPYDEDEYVFDAEDAAQALEAASRPLCLFGHTHVQIGFLLSPQGLDVVLPDQTPALIELSDAWRYLINPGSVGQPRDGDPRAAYAILDAARREVALYRVEYPLDRTQAKIRAAGLPQSLADRLATGR